MNILSSFTHLHVAMLQMHTFNTMEVSGFNQLFGYP